EAHPLDAGGGGRPGVIPGPDGRPGLPEFVHQLLADRPTGTRNQDHGSLRKKHRGRDPLRAFSGYPALRSAWIGPRPPDHLPGCRLADFAPGLFAVHRNLLRRGYAEPDLAALDGHDRDDHVQAGHHDAFAPLSTENEHEYPSLLWTPRTPNSQQFPASLSHRQ